MTCRRATLLMLVSAVCFAAAAAKAADDALEQAALMAAVDRIAPCVVRIETVGGLERVGGLALGTGPTTGLIVDSSGHVVTSAFNFVGKPTSILVRLADGTRKPARMIATDHSRMLVLLKIDPEGPLPSPDAVPMAEMRVGQWSIAVGHTFESDRPNMAVGILSALNRIWGKAIQTDAAVSPNNYGGPLVDIQGRVLGVLVPLSPDGTDEMAGIEWYDSGIGFAIPFEHIQKALPRLIQGEDLRPGLMGFSLIGPNQYTCEPIIKACHPKSPATASGLKPGDRIVAIDGRPISRAADVRQEIGRRYAGDSMRVTVMRGDARSDHDATLVPKLEPFQHGFLGILPMRTTSAEGVPVRYVFPGSPAATSGITTEDVIVSLQGEPVTDRHELQLKVGAIEPKTQIELVVRRDGKDRKVALALAAQPEALPPAELPPSRPREMPADADRPSVGAIRWTIPEFPNEIWSYVPDRYTAEASYGVVVWLHGTGGYDWQKTLALWKPLCDRYDMILIAPKSNDAGRWMPTEAALIDRLLAKVAGIYNVDSARVAVHGYESGGALAFFEAFRNRDNVCAVAAVEAIPMGQPPENDPLSRFSMYVATAGNSRVAKPVAAAVAACRNLRIPVTTKDLGETPRYLDADELAELARWLDSLDRI